MSCYSDMILQIKEKISQADAVIIGAGAGAFHISRICIYRRKI